MVAVNTTEVSNIKIMDELNTRSHPHDYKQVNVWNIENTNTLKSLCVLCNERVSVLKPEIQGTVCRN